MALDSERLLTRRIRGNSPLNTAARLIAALCAALLICSVCVSAQTSASTTSSAATQRPAPQQPGVAANAIPSYPDSPAGLEQLIKDMLKLQKDGDAKALAPYVQSLILPEPDAWFRATFGNQLGTQLADSYDRIRMNLPLSFPDMLSQIQSKHLNKEQATLFTDSCNQESSSVEYELLISRTHEQPLYHIRLSSSTEAAVVGFFVHLDGAFRYIGNFQVSALVLRVGGNVMTKKLISGPKPHYPAYALEKHVSGTVLLHAIIGTGGKVCVLQVVSGPPELVGAAFEAVRQWQYSPTTLNGKPVTVDTTMSVVFDFSD
jgi:TonB family protein